MSDTTTTTPPFSLADVSSTLLKFENNASTIVQQQSNIINALQNETTYLQGKQASIADRQSTDSRLIDFNQNFSKRYVDYIKMIVSFAVGLGITVILISLNKMDVLSTTLATMLTIVVLSISFIIVYRIYTKMLGRDNMNYDRVLTTPPPDSAFAKGGAANGGSLNGLTGLCVGSECCDVRSTIWNVDLQQCTPLPTNTDTMTGASAGTNTSASTNATSNTSTTTSTTAKTSEGFETYRPVSGIAVSATNWEKNEVKQKDSP